MAKRNKQPSTEQLEHMEKCVHAEVVALNENVAALKGEFFNGTMDGAAYEKALTRVYTRLSLTNESMDNLLLYGTDDGKE